MSYVKKTIYMPDLKSYSVHDFKQSFLRYRFQSGLSIFRSTGQLGRKGTVGVRSPGEFNVT